VKFYIKERYKRGIVFLCVEIIVLMMYYGVRVTSLGYVVRCVGFKCVQVW
jgi:hypothetical protein